MNEKRSPKQVLILCAELKQFCLYEAPDRIAAEAARELFQVAVQMELSRREVPLYGQAKVFALLPGLEPVPEDAEVFIVLEGSTLAHVIRAQSDVMLCFMVPGHNLAEVVSVQAYLCSEATPLTWVGGARLEFIQDDAQDLAEHLVTHGHRLSSRDHKELSSLFNLGQESSRWAMDRRVALAMANLDIPHNWNVLGSPCGQEYSPKESPLHLAVRWGLYRLAELLLCQPGGLMAVTLPNEEGVTPLQLAQRAGNTELLELLTHPPNPLATPPAGLSQVWADRSRLLRFCHDTQNLSLTVRQNLRWGSQQSRQTDILLFRERLRDEDFLREIKALRRERSETIVEREELVDDPRENALYPHISGDNSVVEENDYEEPLMFCLNEEDEEEEPSQTDSEKSQSMRGSQAPCTTQAAASRLSAMIHGKDQVYANAMLVDQVDDVDIKYHSPPEEVVGSVPQRGSPCWDSFTGSPPDTRNHLRHPSPPQNGERGIQGSTIGHHREQSSHVSPSSPFASSPSFPSSPLASPFRLLEGGQRRQTQPSLPLSPRLSHRGTSLPEETWGLSPSLEAVECESGEDDILAQSYPSSSPKQQLVLQSSTGEERDSFDISPDLNRTHSDSTNNSTKDPGEAEVRLRSYSYSSPKAKPSRPLLNRDATISDLSEEQRAFSLTETSREKRALGFRKRAQSAEEESSASLQHLTLSEFLKEIEDEEWDKYIIPSKVESEKYKVSRTFSFLKNRMSSTRNKTKVKGKEVKEGKERSGGTSNGHQFVPVSPAGSSLCVACDKPVPGKDLLQCSNCSLSVHKGCRESAAACGKKPPEKNALMMKSKALSLSQTLVVKEGSPASRSSTSTSSPSSSSLSTMMSREKRDTAPPLSKSSSVSIDSRRLSDVAAVDGEASGSAWGSGSLTEEGTQITATPPSTDPPTTEEPVDARVLSDLSADLLGFEAESWSLSVSPEFCRQHDKHTVKRQDVIYELMQTELHHIQTLTVMSEVFRRGMLEQLQLDWDCVARIFPCLDPLLLFHRNLFGALQERRHASAQPEYHRNYLIQRVGDVLLQQFSDENAEKMKQVYGEFCSHHTEAVNVFKELQQQNKKLQVFVKQQSNNSLVRRREVPEFILLVTQRITKYPVLLERILQYTPEGSQEHSDLSRALAQIREVIAAVDLSVNKYERGQELQEVLARLENKSLAKLKNGKVFRKQDLLSQHRALQHKGLIYWKTATGRLKDTLALLLTDVLVFLQEKDQRFIFAAVDQKAPVIPLQKLIVREVANEERGMFLISASSVGPEMYEVHTATREERNAWMRHIRQAVESCPEEEEEEERSAESEEARRAGEARVQKIHKFQETLLGQDQRICSSLEEKLQLYAELTELTLHSPEPIPQRHLLVHPDADTETPRQGSTLLAAALREAEKLIATLQVQEVVSVPNHSSPVTGPECCSYNSHGSIQESPSEADYLSTLSVSSNSLVSDSEWAGSDGLLWHSVAELRRGDTNGTQLKVAESVQSLTQLLYSLQAAVTLQDSCYEVQKLLLLEGERPQPRTSICLHNNLEQEKQRSLDRRREEVERRSLEKKREEAEGVQKLHAKLKHEQQRWDRECQAREKQQGEQESLLEQRERQCLLEAERLRCEREELEAQLLEYQQNLDRLREGQRSVEREKEKIEAQQRLLQSWRHNRQSSLPVMIPQDGCQISSHSRSGSLDGNGSVYENEAALLRSLQQNHLHYHHHNNNQHQNLHSGQKTRQDSPLHSPSHTPSLGLSPSLYNSLNTLLSQAHGKPYPDSLAYPQYSNSHNCPRPINAPIHPFSSGMTTRHLRTNNNSSPPLDRYSLGSWRSGIPGVGLYEEDYPPSASLTPLLTPQAYLSLEGQNGEDGGEENIVYL